MPYINIGVAEGFFALARREQAMEFVITGSVAYDYLMRFPGHFRDHILPDQLDNLSVSFLAESMRRERGGVAANVAYTMKLLGAATR